MSERGSNPLWGGRFGASPAEAFERLNASIPFDIRLAPYDIQGSIAHARMLGERGIITVKEVEDLVRGLHSVLEEVWSGRFSWALSDEDVHTAVERRLRELVGDVALKLHTGRSRNDQVALDLHLFVRDAAERIRAALLAAMRALVEVAEGHKDLVLPGYTHLQRAQPVLLAHHLLAHFWAFGRDVDRWRDALDRADVSPLGAGALAGSSLPLDPDDVARELGFACRFENSLDAVSDRDFVAETLFVAALTQSHLSRLGEEIVVWATEEFGFVRLADAYSTGSSMLPQKKNPDIAELARGGAGRVIGDLTGVLATLKGLPLAYNRDLQGDKEPLFDALDTCTGALRAVAALVDSAEFVPERMRAAADDAASAATDLAELLVQQGVPFRDAHESIGELVRQSVERGIALEELVMADARLGPHALALLEPGEAVRRRTTPGGAGPEPVRRQLAAARTRLDEQGAWLDGR